MRKSSVSMEQVKTEILALEAEGLSPSRENLQSRIGGGTRNITKLREQALAEIERERAEAAEEERQALIEQFPVNHEIEKLLQALSGCVIDLPYLFAKHGRDTHNQVHSMELRSQNSLRAQFAKERAEFKQELELAKSQISHLETQNKALSDDLRQQNKASSELKTQADDLRAELTREKSINQRLEGELVGMQKSLEGLEKAHSALLDRLMASNNISEG